MRVENHYGVRGTVLSRARIFNTLYLVVLTDNTGLRVTSHPATVALLPPLLQLAEAANDS